MNTTTKTPARRLIGGLRAGFLRALLPFIFCGSTTPFCAGAELLTDEKAPYTYEASNWRAGNYIQSLFYAYSDLPAISENFIGKGVLPGERYADLYCPGNTGIDLLDFCEEADFTPVVRLDLIKRVFKSIYKSHYADADAIWCGYSGTKRQTSFLNPCTSSGVNYVPVTGYPAGRLIARNLPDTQSEGMALVWPMVQVNGKWLDDADSTFRDVKDNEADQKEGSFTSVREYSWPAGAECAITGKGWNGQMDKVLELTISSPATPGREALQLVFSNITDSKMGFSAPYPTKLSDTIQLPDGTEISSKEYSVSNPDFNHILIYAKDADRTGFEYQNAMVFGWAGRPSKVTVHWEAEGKSSSHAAYPGTTGITDTQSEWHSGGYHRVDVEYAGSGAISEKLFLERFQGVDPSASLRHLHKIAGNVLATGSAGMPGYNATESAWLEEPVSGLAAAAYILCKYDEEEDRFEGDYADEARRIATKLVDDRIAMWERGRKTSSIHEFVTGAYYLSRLYGLPGKFNDPEKQKYYYDWMCRWADQMVAGDLSGSGRYMVALWRAYELSGNEAYKELYQKGRNRLLISPETGLTVDGKWKEPWDLYSYGDIMAALGRRGYPEDVRDIQTLITYLEQQKRWTDTGFMGCWWEVTVENHNFWGRWCKGLQMEDAPKQIFSISDFPAYYKKDGKVVVEMTDVPPIFNPEYWDQEVMKKYLPFLPRKIAQSILFRIDNIFLKNDYQNEWWVGSQIPSVVRDLNLIRDNVRKILAWIDEGTAMTTNGPEVQKLLAESNALFAAIAPVIDPPVSGKPSPGGNPISLGGELVNLRSNHDYLKAVLGGWKPAEVVTTEPTVEVKESGSHLSARAILIVAAAVIGLIILFVLRRFHNKQ